MAAVSAGAEQDTSNLLADRRAAGFTRGAHAVPRPAQVADQPPELRALAGAVDSFERDKGAALFQCRGAFTMHANIASSFTTRLRQCAVRAVSGECTSPSDDEKLPLRDPR